MMTQHDPLLDALPRVRDRFVRHNLVHVVHVVRDLELPGRHAKQALARFFAEHGRLGSSDRALIAGLVFTLVRWRRRIEAALLGTSGLSDHALGTSEFRTLLHCGMLLSAAGYESGPILDGIGRCAPLPNAAGDLAAWFAAAGQTLRGLDPVRATTADELAVRASFPDWVVERWVAQYGFDRARAIAVASRRRAPAVLRANLLRTVPAALIEELGREGVGAEATRLSLWGVALAERKDVHSLPAFREGRAEFQDEGSQLVALVTGVQPGDRVVDACAGAGGKTLALAMMMENRGEILALDTDAAKLEELRKRSRRAGVRIVAQARADDARVYGSWAGRADVVLVDAPCSGSGTWRRVPDGPYHCDAGDLSRFAAAQRKLLSRYAALVRPGGRLVYATCSLFREENEEVVEAWLKKHDRFGILEARAAWPRDLAARVAEGPWLALTPEQYGTDGFFCALMERKT